MPPTRRHMLKASQRAPRSAASRRRARRSLQFLPLGVSSKTATRIDQRAFSWMKLCMASTVLGGFKTMSSAASFSSSGAERSPRVALRPRPCAPEK